MSIRLAFSTVACPDWTLEQVVARAKEYGYEGVELRTLGPGGSGLASDPALSDPGKVAQILEQSGVAPVCLSTSTALHFADATRAHRAVRQLEADLELAAALRCGAVRIFGSRVEPGETQQTVMQRIAERIKPLVDKAGRLGVQILFENAGSFNQAQQWWWLLNLVDHPMAGMCWNVANAAAVGEPPAVSVPCLNSRIRLAKVKDTAVGEGSGFVPLGTGTVGIEAFLKRLLGIGYEGFISVEWDRLWFPSLAPAEEHLPDAQKRLRDWLAAIALDVEEGRKSVAKTAAKNAPKPMAAAAK